MDSETTMTPAGAVRLPTGTATLLLTDVEGSTRLWEADEAVAARVLARHLDLIGEVVARRAGVRPLEQGEGDSVVAAFADTADAVAAALEIQLVLAAEPWPDGTAPRVRTALHTGPVQLRDAANYAGPTIIRCARLRDLAHGGQTLLSDAAQDAAAGSLPEGASLRALGVHRLKDLGRPERVWQLDHPRLEPQFPPLRSVDATANNLPAQLTSLVGRDADLARLRVELAAHRLVTLTGPGGVGKTRLAAHAAADALDRHPDGAWWVDLGPVNDPRLVAQSAAVVFGLRKEHARPLSTTVADHLTGWDTLVVFDNCEQVLDAVAALVGELLAAAPRVRILTTSREPLGIDGELTWRVPSLRTPAAVELFVERAARARPGFEPDTATREVIEAIAERLDGLPLAIELAAARTRMMPPDRIASGLDQRFRLLTGGSRNSVGRQQTLESSVAWSYDLLEEPERLVLDRLSVFTGGFTLEAAEVICADGEHVDSYAVLDLLTRLVDKSLVQADSLDGRYRLLETIRQFVLARVAAGDTVRDRHLDYFVRFAERAAAGLSTADAPAWLTRLEQDHENLRAAFDWADAGGQGEACLRLVAALAVFWELRSHLGRGSRWFARALAHDTGPSVVRARALWAAAHVALYQDDITTVLTRAPEALEMAIAMGDQSCVVRARNTASYLRVWFDPPGARAELEENVALAEAADDAWAVGDALKMTTITWMLQEDWEPADRSFADLREFALRSDNRFFRAWAHYGVGYGALRRGRLDLAESELTAALALCDQIGDPATGGMAHAALGELDAARGQFGRARDRLEEFVTTAGPTGGNLGLPFARLALAEAALRTGDPGSAAAWVAPLVDRYDNETGLPLFRAWALALHGAALTEDPSGAAQVLGRARAVAAQLGNPRLIALTDEHLGRLSLRQGQLGEARDAHHRALAARVDAGFAGEVCESLDALAEIAGEYGSHEEAVRLVGAAGAARARLTRPRAPAVDEACARVTSASVAALGARTAEEAFAAGTALSLDEAVAYVSRTRGIRRRPSTGWEALTPTELDVVRLAARGLTNPQIGEQLFVSRATVKTHLAHAFAKLGVASRAELAVSASRRGAV